MTVGIAVRSFIVRRERNVTGERAEEDQIKEKTICRENICCDRKQENRGRSSAEVVMKG